MCKGLATLPATCLKGAKDIKHKISFLLQKPEPQPADQKQPKEKTKRVPSPAEVEKWKESFSHVMSSDAGRTVFTEFLKSEFSEENMDFWTACEDYRQTAPSKLPARAKQVYQQYVKADAPKEVNLDAETREETRQNVASPCPACFDRAQKAIYALMEKDSYRRFLRSRLLQDLHRQRSCDRADGGKPLTGGA